MRTKKRAPSKAQLRPPPPPAPPPLPNPVQPDHKAAESAEVLMMTADYLATMCLDSEAAQRRGVVLPSKTAWRLAEVLLGVTHHLLDSHEEYPPKVRALGRALLAKFTAHDEREAA